MRDDAGVVPCKFLAWQRETAPQAASRPAPPHRELIQEMQDEGIDFYRTDLYGTVTVTAQADGSFTVQTAKQPAEELAPAA